MFQLGSPLLVTPNLRTSVAGTGSENPGGTFSYLVDKVKDGVNEDVER